MKALKLLTLSAILAAPTQAQELRLFEQPEGAATEAPNLANPAPIMAQGGQPAYTLRSISRFGERFEAVFVDRAGQPVRAHWNAGESAGLPNSGFTIAAAGPGTVSLMHPPGDNCIAFEPAVSCSAGNRSELKLALAAPLASNGAPPPFVGPQQQGPFGAVQNGAPLGVTNAAGAAGFVTDGGQQVFINPFSGEPEVLPQLTPEEAAARQQRQDLRAARLRQLEPRIQDHQVPQGMERLRTPFGDRLVPIRE